MKEFICLIIIIIFNVNNYAQNLGINTTTPLAPLHVQATGETTAILENQSSLTPSLTNSMYFAYGIQLPVSNKKYAAAIKTIGTGTNSARLAFFTGATNFQANLFERMTIDNDGRVGIGNNSPAFGFDVNTYTRFIGPVGFMTDPNGYYALNVGGSVRIDGTVNPYNTLAIGNNTTIEGTLTVNNGKGIVRSTNSTQMKIRRTTASLAFNNLGAGQTATSGPLNFGEDFTSVTVTVGHVNNGTGDFQKVLVVPFNVNEINNTCQFHVTNVASSTITFTGSWEVVLIGN